MAPPVPSAQGTPASWSYILIRLLFRFVLKIFYGSIVVENSHFIPPNGTPCIVVANHSNSLTDALLMVTSVPRDRRDWLRLTAKATQFGRRTFTSWLIESAGTVPISRRKDMQEGQIDNTNVMLKLMEALELGDAVLLFPEGMSRFHPEIAPLKTGVARLISDVLSRNKDNTTFEIAIQTCSITYMHRQHFRSDVLVTFHEPLMFTPKDNPELLAPVDYQNIRHLTSTIHTQIRSGTLDSPSWGLIRISRTAARLYAPLGTYMTLGDYVRVTRTFLECFRDAKADSSPEGNESQDNRVLKDLFEDLKMYQNEISGLSLPEDRLRQPFPYRVIFFRMFVRLLWAVTLMALSLPGLVLWFPIFVTTYIAVHEYKKTGPIFDTYDEIAQYKLTYGLISGLIVYFLCIMLTFQFALITSVVVPATMWMALRWFEDAVSSLRSFFVLWRLLCVGSATVSRLHRQRDALYLRVKDLAVNELGLPQDPEEFFSHSGDRHKGRIVPGWRSSTKYFSLRRRRKRDWNETLRLYDVVDYPEE